MIVSGGHVSLVIHGWTVTLVSVQSPDVAFVTATVPERLPECTMQIANHWSAANPSCLNWNWTGYVCYITFCQNRNDHVCVVDDICSCLNSQGLPHKELFYTCHFSYAVPTWGGSYRFNSYQWRTLAQSSCDFKRLLCPRPGLGIKWWCCLTSVCRVYRA